MDAQEFQQNLARMEPAKRDQMMKMLKVMSAPPESLVALFDRLGLRWERKYIGSESEFPMGAVVIDWRDFMLAEQEQQRQGPVMKRLLAEEFSDVATDAQIARAVPKIHSPENDSRPPVRFDPVAPPPNNGEAVPFVTEEDTTKGVE